MWQASVLDVTTNTSDVSAFVKFYQSMSIPR
jgi:hypothetical protein